MEYLKLAGLLLAIVVFALIMRKSTSKAPDTTPEADVPKAGSPGVGNPKSGSFVDRDLS